MEDHDISTSSITMDEHSSPRRRRQSRRIETGDASFMDQRIEKDPIVILNEVLCTSSRFHGLLMDMESTRIRINSDASRSALDAEARGLKDGVVDSSIDVRLQGFLDVLHDSAKLREEQCRELTVLIRDAAAVNWEGIDILNILDGFTDGSGHVYGAIAGTIKAEDTGWTGEVITQDQRAQLESPNNEIHTCDLLDVDHSLEDAGPHASPSTRTRAHSLHSTSGDVAAPSIAQAALPGQTADLVKLSVDLVISLSSLSDTIHSTSSLATATSRQLRGIRAGVDSWREREAQEDAAKIAIDDWERKKLKAGLGGGEGTKGLLDEEVKRFKETLVHSEERVRALTEQIEHLPRWTEVFS